MCGSNRVISHCSAFGSTVTADVIASALRPTPLFPLKPAGQPAAPDPTF
jgi:hypothetical protein